MSGRAAFRASSSRSSRSSIATVSWRGGTPSQALAVATHQRRAALHRRIMRCAAEVVLQAKMASQPRPQARRYSGAKTFRACDPRRLCSRAASRLQLGYFVVRTHACL